VDLALNSENSNGDLVLLKDIAKRQQISIKYLESIFSTLRKAGIIKGIRGAKGGYRLLKEANEITIYDVIYTMQGFIAPVGCVEETSKCDMAETCATKSLWNELTESISKTLKRYTLADLVHRHPPDCDLNPISPSTASR